MNRTFKQLTAEQKYQISTLLSKGFTQKQIAVFVGKSESCICREFKRNKMYSGKYDANNAHQYTVFRHRAKPKKISLTSEIKAQIELLLQQDLSPQQISHRLSL
jgi:IS30 family transposase